MRLPRDVSGPEVARRLRRFGYEVVRQTGSHMRLVARGPTGEHAVTIPAHRALRVGTLRSIVGDVAAARGEDVATFVERMFEG